MSARKKSPKSKKQSIPKGKDAGSPPSAGYLVSCDIPTKQYIQYLNELKAVDKKFIIQDLDPTHLLVKHKAKAEIEEKIEDFFNSNVFSPVEKVGEEFDMS